MTDLQVITTNPKDNKEIYKSLFKNKTLMLLWSGKFISIIGDSFFDIAVMWVVYAQSQSVLQSALVGVAFHLSTVLMSPIAGVVTDRLDRKTIMWSSNLLAALIVGITAVLFSILGYLPLLVAIISILLLNAMTTFINPAEASVMPEIVGKEHLVKANGIFSAIGQIGTLIGQAAAGITIALIGAGWALTWDAISFVLVAFCIFLASIPKRTNVTKEASKKDKSFWVDLKTGWNYISKVPVLKGIIVLTLLINFSSFMGALYPALVNQQLNSSAGTYSLVMMSAVIGSMIGGVFIGF